MANNSLYETAYKPEGALGGLFAGYNMGIQDDARYAAGLSDMMNNMTAMQTYGHNERMNPLLVEQQSLSNRTAAPAANIADLIVNDPVALQMGANATEAGWENTVLGRDKTKATQSSDIYKTNMENIGEGNERELATISTALDFASQFQDPQEKAAALQVGLERGGITQDSPFFPIINRMVSSGKSTEEILKVFGVAANRAASRQPSHIREMQKLRDQLNSQMRIANMRGGAADFKMLLDAEQKYFEDLIVAAAKHDSDIVKQSMRKAEWEEIQAYYTRERTRIERQMKQTRLMLRKALKGNMVPDDIIDAEFGDSVKDVPTPSRTMDGSGKAPNAGAAASAANRGSVPATQTGDTGLQVPALPPGVKLVG